MNPPSALHSAMGRDRKPFTYTPGGLDLSEIKSERMAKRLMRNAMNQGVPEVPVHPVHSSTNQSAPVALPNYNCLPIQVFPTFNLPANPKSLLRSRSNPDPTEAPIQRIVPPFINTTRFENNDTFHKNTPTQPQINNNRPMSMYEYNAPPANPYSSLPRTNYGSDGYTAPVLPEISYDAEYFRAPPKLYSETEQLPKLEISEEKDKLLTSENLDSSIDLTVTPIIKIHDVIIPTITSTPIESMPVEENGGTENEQREVKVVKKQVKKENKVEEQNGNQNGDTSIEAEMTVKLPTKKSAAKTETKVEVVKKILPDGSVEEIKTTTTKTTVDGRTEIKTKTETRTIPKEEESEEEVVEEEEEEEEEEEKVAEQEEEVVEEPETVTVTTTVAAPKENGQQSSVVKTEERSETTTTKKVVVVQESPKEESQSVVEEEEVEEVEEEAEPVTVVLKKQVQPEPEPAEPEPVEEEEIEENEEEETKQEVVQKVEKVEIEQEVEEEEKEGEVVEEEVEVKKEVEAKAPTPKDEEEEEEEEEEYEEAEETETKVEQETEVKETVEEKEEVKVEVVKEEPQQEETPAEAPAGEPKESPKEPEEKVIKVEIQAPEESKPETKEEKVEPEPPKEYKIPIREPSVPLEKVEDVEIKPIGISPIVSKTHTENTEIITSTISPSGGLSTQTEYNKIENIVTVNRTTKILDNSYENLTQQGIPTVRTYFPPPSIDKISTSPLPSRPYQPVYPPEPQTERRHSLLLDRLSTERQMPSDLYQSLSNQSYDQAQFQSEPQSEVLTVSNVKPSKITNQQWYQQTKQQQNNIYNNVSSTPTPVGQPWAQPKSQPQPQQQYQPQPQQQYQPQPQYQAQHQLPPQPHYQAQHQAQPQYQAPPPQQPSYQLPSTPQPQYQPSYIEPTPERAPSSYSTYTPTPTWVSNVETPQNNSQPTQYSYLNKDTSDSYQRSTQQYSSSYVPPPWEQDSSYTSVNNTSQTFYQPAPQTPAESFTPAPTQGWKPPAAKFTKTPPIAYIPPAPNQSFVRSASTVDPPRSTPGRKTYYSEYERRYISVPDSTYIPSETKFQPQPDPSPQYYYDNNEPSEPVEPQWRKELREFTEKTSQTTTTTTTEQTSVQPPWQPEQQFAKTPSVTYNPTPTWSQTLRPRSWRERSFESEYVSQEWPKTNTLGRGRPLSTIGKSVDAPIPERSRGVSVDRYNPNNYQSPAEHPPVQTHTLTTPVAHAGYHNPNVPAYHTRASAEPREQPAVYQQRVYRESRASPLQSRSFKYLQWITGTDD